MEGESVYERIKKELFPLGWDYEQEDHFYIIMVECDYEYAEHVMPVPYDGVSQSIAKAAICMLEQDDPSIPGDYWVAFSRACSDPSACAVCVRREEELEAAAKGFFLARARERAALGPTTKAQKDAAFAEWETELGRQGLLD